MLLPAVAPLDRNWLERAADHQARLTMPPGALGRLLELGRQLCAVQETLRPRAEPAAIVVMAADHGVAAEGVSAYPQEVTGQMVLNFLNGGAAISVLARRQRAQLLVVDMGIKDPTILAGTEHSGFRGECAVGRGTASFLHQPAMTADQAEQALAVGTQIVRDCLLPQGVRVVALGEMGIGNTSSASALTAALTARPAEQVTGRGTGLVETAWRHKVAVVERALARHFPGDAGPVDPMAALTALGGFEIAGLAGLAVAAAAARVLVVLDGFISSVAGLIAVRLSPAVRDYLVASHRSVEPGHRAVLEALELTPLLDLGMRLGEATGAALALNPIQCAADIQCDMATFASAGVTDRPS